MPDSSLPYSGEIRGESAILNERMIGPEVNHTYTVSRLTCGCGDLRWCPVKRCVSLTLLGLPHSFAAGAGCLHIVKAAWQLIVSVLEASTLKDATDAPDKNNGIVAMIMMRYVENKVVKCTSTCSWNTDIDQVFRILVKKSVLWKTLGLLLTIWKVKSYCDS